VRRRDFIAFLGGAAAVWPQIVRAQQPAMPLVGFLSSRSPGESADLVVAFNKGLGEAGYVDGQNLAVEYRWGEGQYDRLPNMAADLVRRGVAVMVTTGGEPAALAAKAATSTIPIVFAVGGDPVKAGLVESFSRPGGNATGVSVLTTTPESKRLGLLHEMVPGAKVVGVLINPNYQVAEAQALELRSAAGTIGQRLHIAYAKNDAELESALETLVREHADALLVSADPFFDTRRERIIAFVAEHRIPAVYQFRQYAVAGGLMSYGVSLPDGYRQAGNYAGQILKGAKPADLPVFQLTRFEFVINLKTAKILGLEVPAMLLARADEVIE
jgi:putative tryptophan/tyrosine transport system substrate-binding protein